VLAAKRGYFCFSADLQPATACCLSEPSGSGEALTISSHASRAAARVAAASPLPAFSQMPSILLLVAAGNVGIAFTPLLQDSTAAATAGVFAGAVVAVELGALPLVELLLVLLVELLLELPQPASNATATSGTNSQVKSMRIV
jgi:hypothetical protein